MFPPPGLARLAKTHGRIVVTRRNEIWYMFCPWCHVYAFDETWETVLVRAMAHRDLLHPSEEVHT